MAKRGISEKIQYAYNPLPDISEAAVLKRAELDDIIEPAKPSPFDWLWKYGAGLGSDRIHLLPQKFHALRASEAQEFLIEFQEQGGVVISDPSDKEEVKKATIRGLTAAHGFYRDRGKKQLSEIRKNHGYSADEMADRKYDHWPYYKNQAIADIIHELLADLRKPSAGAGDGALKKR
jgi:hypothetical protein